MAKTIKLKKGYDINIAGRANESVVTKFKARTHAIQPTDFIGLSPIPKVTVQIGDEVKAGDVLFFDKKQPSIKYTAPVSGEIIEITRGAKRAIVGITILADSENKYKELPKVRISSASKEEITNHLLNTGCWPFLRQRPFNILANPSETPKAIFISGFDTTPLGPNYDFVLKGQEQHFQTGVEVLGKLTSGKVNLGLAASNNSPVSAVKNATVTNFSGKHPVGCVGIQIHHVDPIGKGEVIWTINPQDVVAIGRVFNTNKFDTERLIAVAGPVAKQPQYYKTYLGASVDSMLANNTTTDNLRVVSGSVLSGTKITQKGYVGFFHHQVNVLEEGNKHEFFGWMKPSLFRKNITRVFPAFLGSNKTVALDTNTHGEHRAFVVTGLYEKVLPMDIYPMQLIKAIMYRDFDLMEGLGIYEVVEEDLALCEYVCPSKTEIQYHLRDGLNYMKEQA